MINALILALLLSLASCQDSENAVVIAEPIIQNPAGDQSSSEFEDQSREEDFAGNMDITNEGSVLGPSDPCFTVLNSGELDIIASCRRVHSPRLNSGYKYRVQQSHLCLGQRKDPLKRYQYKLEGFIREVDRRDNNFKRRVEVEGTNIGDEVVHFSTVGSKLKTQVTFNRDTERLVLKQRTSGVFSKRRRYAAFSCFVFPH